MTAIPDTDTLTPRQRQILDVITAVTRDRGYPPTVREIGRAVGISSPNGVLSHLDALQRKGFLTRDRGRSRSLRVVSVPADTRGPAAGNVVSAGDVRVLEGGKLVKYDRCLMIQFASEDDVRRAIKGRAAAFTMFEEGQDGRV